MGLRRGQPLGLRRDRPLGLRIQGELGVRTGLLGDEAKIWEENLFNLTKLAIVVFAILGLGVDNAPDLKQQPSMVRLILYTPACAIVEGDTIDVIVEVQNTGGDRIDVSDNVELERIVELAAGSAPKSEPDAANRAHARFRAGEWHLKMSCFVPSGSKEKFIIARVSARTTHLREVAPSGSVFIKVPLPKDAFERGSCKLLAATVDGTIHSQVVKIESVASTPDLRDKERR